MKDVQVGEHYVYEDTQSNYFVAGDIIEIAEVNGDDIRFRLVDPPQGRLVPGNNTWVGSIKYLGARVARSKIDTDFWSDYLD